MRIGIAALILAYVLSQFYRAFLAVMTPVLKADLGLSAADLASASGWWFLAFAAMQIPIGSALDRIGPRLTAGVLLAVGAHEIINPELQMGQRLARNLAHPTILEQIALDENTNLVELANPEQFIGKSQEELDLRRRYGISVVAVRRAGQVLPPMGPADRLERGDRLIVVGPPASVRRIASLA